MSCRAEIARPELPRRFQTRGRKCRAQPATAVSSAGCTVACRRARGRQRQALRMAAKWRPSLTTARHDGAIELRRRNGFAEVEQKNAESKEATFRDQD